MIRRFTESPKADYAALIRSLLVPG